MPLTTRPLSTSRQAMMRLVSMSEGAEVAEQLQSDLSGFFWMKLHTENVVPLYRRAKAPAVLAARRGCFAHGDAKGMREVDERQRRDFTKEPRGWGDLKLIPAHVRGFDLRGKTLAFARE